MKNEFRKGYEIGLHDGKMEALKELQESNKNTELPSNETLFKIFTLVFECKENWRKTSSVYMNEYEGLANYVTQHWEEDA